MAYKFSKGSRGLGDIVFEDDADTGIDFEPDTIKLETNGVERVVVTNTGLGVGLSNPSTTFHAYADASNAYVATIDNDAGTSAHGLKVSTDGTGTGTNILALESASSTVFKVRGDGRVGIGVDTPGSTLSVDDEIAVGEKLIHRGDPDTYLQFPSNDSITLCAGGSDALTIESGGYLKLHSGIKYSRGVLVSASSSPAEVGGWIKFATFNCPGGSSLDTAASSFLVTLAGMESSNNRRLDGTFLVHAKFTVNIDGIGTDGANVSNAYYEPEGTFVYCEPLNADHLSAAGANDFAPASDLLMIFTNDDSTPVVDLYIKANAKNKHCFVTHLGGTGQVNTSDTDTGFTINTSQSWLSTEPAAPAGSVKIGGTWASKVFSDLRVSGLVYDAAEDPTITFSEGGTEKATIGVNSSDNIVLENKTINKHIVLKVNDQGVVKEGLRLDGAVPEVVVNQTSDSLVDFRVESDNETHMLFVDGSQDRIGVKTSNPLVTLDIEGDVRNNGGVYRKYRDVGSTGNILQTDYVIRCTQTSAITLTLPSKSNNNGQMLIIKDTLGNANSNNITVTGNSSDTIDGSANYVISFNGESVTLMCDGVNGWMILSRVRP